ncbi:MAG TPA: EamA family transporter [Bryobacteraceae bacterium]|nr:EamA family transporter [Bryobacteraceae bacterium]
MIAWLLVAAIVTATAGADLLQTLEMKRHSGASVSSTAAAVFRRPLLLAAIGCMAVSFFSFMALLRVADLSFAVPATAASFVLETLLAKYVLRERVDARRWFGAVLVAAGVALLAL